LTAASHLLLALVDSHVERLGGEVVYRDTDSAFVTPSGIVGEVAGALASLSPYSVEVPFLKDETAESAPREQYPKGSTDLKPRFFGLSSKRYCLFARDKAGRPHVFRKAASDHGLGSYQVGGDREEWVAQLWERIIEKGVEGADDYAGVPATSDFSLSTPNLLPRIRRLGELRPFTFLTARLLEPSRDPDEVRSELVAFIGPDDEARRAALMNESRQRSWGSVVEDFVRHRDRKYTFDAEGRAVRRHIFVRRKNLIGLGKEANRVEDSKVLGLAAVRGRAKRYVDPDPRVGSATEVAARLGVSRRTVYNWRRKAASRAPPDASS
ncbi:MAG: helix-turn-helix domain-containing protein, partial [Thermoplasmata archaeon]